MLKVTIADVKSLDDTGFAPPRAGLIFEDLLPGFEETLLTKPFSRAELAKVIHDALAA